MKKFTGLIMLTSMVMTGLTTCSASAGDKIINVLVIGDSLSAGYGVAAEHTYPFLMQQMLEKKEFHNVKITNASISGSTTAGAYSRLKWFLKVKPDILILALGANDGLRGLSTDMMTENLERTILLARENGILVIIAGMKLPPNYGVDYAKAFEGSFASLAEKHNLPFIPFLLENVAGKAPLNQADGIHPNSEGYKIIAVTVFKKLMEQL